MPLFGIEGLDPGDTGIGNLEGDLHRPEAREPEFQVFLEATLLSPLRVELGTRVWCSKDSSLVVLRPARPPRSPVPAVRWTERADARGGDRIWE